MGKNKRILIAVILIVVGIAGVLFCTIPSASREQKAVQKYINEISKYGLKRFNEQIGNYDSDLPEYMREIKKITVVCTDPIVDTYNDSAYSQVSSVAATLKVTGVASNGETVSYVTTNTFQVASTAHGYEVIS